MAAISQSISRRSLVAGAAAAGLASAFAARAALAADDVTFDDECEVLVVGSGYAGLAAAYEAAKAGAQVRVIDKRAFMGGNSYVADGQIAVVGSAAQKAAGIEDSVDVFVSDMLTAGLNLNYKDKCELIGKKSNETFEWTEQEIGVEWATDEKTGEAQLIAQGGHSVMRCIPPKANKGSGIIDPLAEKLSGLGVEVETDVLLSRLVKDADGRVVGAELAFGATDDDASTASSTSLVKVTRGVVMATGGYGADVAWRSAHDPRLDASVGTTNREGATAAGLAVAMAAGALAIQLDQIQCYPYTSPDEESFGVAATWIEAESAYAPTIDPTSGRRFVNELTDRKKFSDAMFEVGQPLLQIGSVDNVPDWCSDSLNAALEAGVTREFDTLDDIAAEYGVPADALKAQMDSYNACVEAGEDTEFGKLLNDDAKPVVTAPYYVTRTWPKVHHCMGGLLTNEDGQCMDAFLAPIAGLYAAGEATGGVHGACRLGCNGTLDCLVNGRIAGQSVAVADKLA